MNSQINEKTSRYTFNLVDRNTISNLNQYFFYYILRQSLRNN